MAKASLNRKTFASHRKLAAGDGLWPEKAGKEGRLALPFASKLTAAEGIRRVR